MHNASTAICRTTRAKAATSATLFRLRLIFIFSLSASSAWATGICVQYRMLMGKALGSIIEANHDVTFMTRTRGNIRTNLTLLMLME